jgi:hypothetical protein
MVVFIMDIAYYALVVIIDKDREDPIPIQNIVLHLLLTAARLGRSIDRFVHSSSYRTFSIFSNIFEQEKNTKENPSWLATT